jgi:hypothetical protein
MSVAADATPAWMLMSMRKVNTASLTSPPQSSLGRDKAARQAAETAIAKAKASGEDCSSTEEALKSWE